MRHALVGLCLVVSFAGLAQAQTRTYSAVAQCASASDKTLSSNGDAFTCAVEGYASARLQTLDDYSGTWEVQCSVDGGVTFDADDELNLTLLGSTAAASVTDTVGIWDVNVAGCTHIKVIATAGFAATDTTFAFRAIALGGGSAGSGGGGGDASAANQTTEIGYLGNIDAALATAAAQDVPHDDADTGSPVKIGGRADTTVPAAVSADGDRVNAWFTPNGALVTRGTDGTNLAAVDPCASEAKTTTAFSQTSIANIITADANKKNYICSIVVVASAAEVVSVVEDDTSGCGSLTAALAGSTTAANGMSFAANGGFALGNGLSSIFVGSANNRYLCLAQSGSNRISGSITWVQR